MSVLSSRCVCTQPDVAVYTEASDGGVVPGGARSGFSTSGLASGAGSQLQ